MSIDSHLLYIATESDDHIWMSTQFQNSMDEQDRFIRTTEWEINFPEGIHPSVEFLHWI